MAKILIIDDEKGLCEEFSDILEDDGHEVQVAHNGADGIRKVEENDFDLIFVDVLMPRMAGTEVYGEIKKRKDVPVVIMSGFLPRGKGRQMLEMGVEAVMRKPLDLKYVMKLIEDISARKKQGS